MKTKLLSSVLLSFYFCLLSSQVPQGFNYQAIARDGSGNPIVSTPLQVRLTVQGDSAGTIVIWQELFPSVTTNSFGLFTLVMGRGTRQSGTAATFDAIDWSVTPKFIKTEVNYGGWKDMGITRFWSVPYSLYSKIAANGFSGNYNDLTNKPLLFDGTWTSLTGKPAFATVATTGSYTDLINKPVILNSQWTTSGSNIYYNSGNVGIGTATPGYKLDVVGRSRFRAGGGDAGIWFMDNTNTVDRSFIGNMGNDHVGFYGAGGTGWGLVMNVNSGNVGIGNTAPSGKMVIQPPATWDDNTPLFEVKNKSGITVFAVYNNGVRAFVQTNSGKGVKGGFAIGGFDPSKAGNVNLMSISPDSIRFYIDNSTTKATKGGFAIGSFNTSKAVNQDFMYVTPQASGNGQYNTFLGYQSGISNTLGNYNTFYGYQTGNMNSNGWANVFIGHQAGKSNIGSPNLTTQPFAGNFNIFIGRYSGLSNSTGGLNVFIGDNSGQANTTAYYNTYVGTRAGCLNQTGTSNAYFGSDAGYYSTGSYNTYIGCKSGYSNTTGNYNVLIGYAAGYNETGSNKLYIARSSTNPPLIYGDFSAGSLGFGTITPGAKLEISSEPSSLYHLRLRDLGLNKKWDIAVDAGYGDATNDDMYILNNAGTHVAVLTNSGSVGIGTNTPGTYKLYVVGSAYCTGTWSGSDIRWKKNINPIENGLNDILSLRAVNFEWRQDEFPSNGFDSGKQIGLVAQEVEKVFPELVKTDDNGYKAVSYEKLSVILLEGMKEQQKQIETYKSQLRSLQEKVDQIESLLEKAGMK